MSTYADVIVPVPLPGTFTYEIPPEKERLVQTGHRVLVPFGAKQHMGVVIRTHHNPPQGIQVKTITEAIDEFPTILPSQLKLWQWIASYYMCALGDVLKAALPAGLKTDKRRRSQKTPEASTRTESALNAAQQKAFGLINASFDEKNVCLLHGVTASGKTEIYIHLIQQVIREGKQVLYLLPEIALTTQITTRLKNVFGNHLGVYHSKFTEAQRVAVWQKQLSDTPFNVILGVRSSIFLPFTDLGLIIIDEEHENSYKQQDPAPRYHARSAAIMLANLHGAKVLLGTATPSIETYHNAITGKYGLVELTQRYKNIKLPTIQVVDTKDLARRKLMEGPFSPLLLNKMRQALAQGEQVIIFQNRRGFAPFIECHTCGWVPKCLNCDVSLTYHKQHNQLTCHYCGFTYPVPTQCPACENKELRSRGFGTERIEDYILHYFPEAKVSRMDLDTTKTRKAYEKLIDDFASGQTNILIGTQMVSKGLDFDKVSVVGIVDADSMLNYPDFRSYERAYHLMAQVAGRAGRKDKQGLVILQTKNPELPIIHQVVENDYEQLYNDQLAERQIFLYPPFCHLIYIYLKHKKESVLDEAAECLSAQLRQSFGHNILGPDKPMVGRIQTLFIRKIIIKVKPDTSIYKVGQYLQTLQQHLLADKRFSALTIYYDVDPQ